MNDYFPNVSHRYNWLLKVQIPYNSHDSNIRDYADIHIIFSTNLIFHSDSNQEYQNMYKFHCTLLRFPPRLNFLISTPLDRVHLQAYKRLYVLSKGMFCEAFLYHEEFLISEWREVRG